MPKILLTQNYVTTSVCPVDQKKLDLFDTQTKGLLLEIRLSGGKTFYLRYQDARGKTRQLRLADSRDVTLSQARTLADKARNKIAMGDDPCAEKANAKLVPTFGKFIAECYVPYIKSYKRSWETDVSLLKNHLLPRFAGRHMDEILTQDIIKMHADRKNEGAAPGSANRLLILMRYMFNLAVKWQVVGIKTNPTKGVPLYIENNKMERYLSKEEGHRLYEAVLTSLNPMLQYIVPMLILTGARKREVLDAKWVDIDIERRTWRVPISKGGIARHIPLSDSVINLLTTIPHADNQWIFPNPETNKPYVSIYYSWNTARKSCGLADVRMHDLRHSFASFLVNAGRTLFEVQKILGHTQIKTTQRYAHLSQDTLRDAANAANHAMGNMFTTHLMPKLPMLIAA